MIFGINITCDISKLVSQISRAFRRVKLRMTISKYHSWYLCQISLQNHATTYTNQDDLVLDVIHQNYLTYGCHSQRFLKFHDFSLTNIKFPWQTEYITISLTVILGTHLFMLLASHLQCTWIDSSLTYNMQKGLI